MSESFEQLFKAEFVQRTLYPGALVQAKVLEIDKDYVVVDAGLKSESWIPTEQFLDEKGELEIAQDSEVEVAIEALEDFFGETILSREKAKRAEAWVELQKAFDNQTTIRGTVTDRVKKGGFTVDMGTLQGFLPGSLVDLRPVRDANFIKGKEFEFKIIQLDPRRNNIVLSRRAVLESEEQVKRNVLLNQLEKGQKVKGYVKNIAEYGVFIDLGGMDGLLHNSDIAWKKVRHPSEILSQEILNSQEAIEVVILKIDRERNRISLGLKQLANDPWIDIEQRYAVGDRLPNREVTHVRDYGCFVEIEPGVEGLVHCSEMDWTNRNANPHKIVRKGLEIDVIILDIDVDLESDRRRISLGIKQCQENPWQTFAARFKKGDRIQGKIRSITDLGLFVGLEGNIDGLVHHSEINSGLSGEEAIRHFKKGDDVEAIILVIDPERERVALSIRDAVEKASSMNESDTLPQEDKEPAESTSEEAKEVISEEQSVEESEKEQEFDSSLEEDEGVEGALS